jgi:DNA recombination protein RmuC
MDLSVLLGALNVVLLVVVIALVARRRGSASSSGDFDRSLAAVRDELARAIVNSQTQVDAKFEAFRSSLETNAAQQRSEATIGRQELQQTLISSLDRLQKGNEEKLEAMRITVDEKLQGTLEKRLGESFKMVSDNLESVQRGLGEMQQLASGVGDLKRVLTNVKNRGGWGEVQLSRQLEDMLTPEQFDANVKIKLNSNEAVEFAVKLPGRQEGDFVYLPIDSKFPHEDYERLLAAQELGDVVAVESASKEMERAIKLQAKTIQDKYIDAPRSTDFAIMYLPTEGLFAEVIRRPGLANELQNKYRILVTGPTTLMSLLNSLQMGFKTLAIEKSTSDVWKILSAAKTEFHKYGEVWDKLSKQLSTAQNTVQEAGRRTRAVEKTLRTVESTALADAGVDTGAELKILDALIAETDLDIEAADLATEANLAAESDDDGS